MSRAPSLSPLIRKEVRALLPLWAGTLIALAAAYVSRHRSISDLGVVGYVGGALALGAHAIGHEYGYRTLPALLAQPATRARLFIAKFAVAGLMLATLAAAAAAVFAADRFRNDGPMIVVLPVLGALLVAPLFTILCRGTLAGAVLGASAPMTTWVIAIIVAWWGFGVDSDTVTAWFKQRWVLFAAIGGPVVGVVTWRAFTMMEAVDGQPLALTLPRWTSARTGARRHAPWRALIAKEFHLQQITIMITLFYGVIWLAGVALRETVPAAVVLPLEAALLLYCLGLAIVIGAVASAEERQQGTLEPQLLQPVAATTQWAIKCIVVLALSIVLGVALPGLLIASFSGESPVRLSANLVLLAVLLTSSSLYISSLASSGVKAMTWSMPASIGAAIFIQTTQSAVASASMQLGRRLPADQTEAYVIAGQLLPVLVVPILLWFGFVNHTSVEHPLRRTLTQIGVLAALVVAVIIAAGALI
jgi:ABC-type transport system involved in multi-copper enzyme maturation permease subunit